MGMLSAEHCEAQSLKEMKGWPACDRRPVAMT